MKTGNGDIGALSNRRSEWLGSKSGKVSRELATGGPDGYHVARNKGFIWEMSANTALLLLSRK
ncbi:MAG: hypothetical protein EXQ84_06915 [Rhodospirillaceae bacterium]|nr:hypothetical protein [Rhodospirillaceae bacterium]